MTITKETIEKVLDPGETVYIIGPGKVIPTKVLEICDDCLQTEEDTLFYDELTITWMLTKREAERMALKSQKSVLY